MAEYMANILLVEDSPADVFLLEAAFEEANVRGKLHVARDGEEALLFVEREGPFMDAPRPDLILLDLNLPRKTGFEVLELLKLHAQYRSIPVVMLTTSSALPDIAQAMRLHANAYHVKPGSLSELIELVMILERYWMGLNRARGIVDSQD